MYKFIIALCGVLFVVGCGTTEPVPGQNGQSGVAGQNGNQGTAGAQGPVGPKGDTGLQGPQGPQGLPGAAPDGGVGPQGPQGPKGDPGSAGSQGPQGSTGAQGPQGNQGVQGPAGPAGPAGTAVPLTKGNLYVVVGNLYIYPGFGNGGSDALCNRGNKDFVLHGACQVSVGVQITDMHSTNDTDPLTASFFHCEGYNNSGAGATVQATATCVRVP